jgi:hypothetical protein
MSGKQYVSNKMSNNNRKRDLFLRVHDVYLTFYPMSSAYRQIGNFRLHT